MEFEAVFCSKTRMRILKLLFKYAQLNTSDVARRVGANYQTALGHLALLKREGVVAERFCGRARFFRFAKTLRARAIIQLLEEWY